MKKLKRPKVIKLKGSDKSFKIGLTNIVSSAKIPPAKSSVR